MSTRTKPVAWRVAATALLLSTAMAQATLNTATNSGNWETGTTWSLGVEPAANHNVVIPTNITVTINGLETKTINSLTITGVLTHAANGNYPTPGDQHKIVLNIAENLTVASGGAIDVSFKGYANGQGPGSLSNSAGHGGEGGGTAGNRGPTYGSITSPTSLGSGGNAVGGGAVILSVINTLTVHEGGAIRADGAHNTGWASRGGAGGTVNIVAGTLAGAGTISAKGGNGASNGGGGGGGRIAVVLTNTTGFDNVVFEAFGGAAGALSGAAGTVYQRVNGQIYGTLIVNNANQATGSYTLTDSTPTNRFDSITTTNAGALAVMPDTVLDLANCALFTDSIPNNITSRIVFGPHANSITWPIPFTNTVAFSQRGTNSLIVPTDVTVASGGVFTHEINGNWPTPGELHKLNLTIEGNLTVASGGTIDVSFKGYAVGQGPGSLSNSAGHGGEGGGTAGNRGPTYGSITSPTSLGSGGNAVGGGAVILSITNTLTVHEGGAIRADGAHNTGWASRGGAGGSLNIATRTIMGAGTISSDGGRVYDSVGDRARGGGGGGRIAVVLTGSGATFAGFDLSQITARGGVGESSHSADSGAAGTIYLQTVSQTWGGLTVDNNRTTGARTHLPPTVNPSLGELRNASVIVTNRGALAITAGDRIGSLTVVSANEPLHLGPAEAILEVSNLTVNGTPYTRTGLYKASDWNGFSPTPSNVSGDGAILITAKGSVIMLR